jgi:hypothetical protein
VGAIYGMCSKETEWAYGDEPWNPPTSRIVVPNSSYSFGFRLLTAPSLQGRDAVLRRVGKAVVHGVPGAVLL